MELESPERQPSKYLKIVISLREGIQSGRYRSGARLPSEAELVRKFGVSRMTVVKALRHLQQEGALTRRGGSGSYVAEPKDGKSRVFGLIIPDLGGTEIFEPICKGMAASPIDSGHSLSWGRSISSDANKEDAAVQLCQHYIEQNVSGVFFAPLEFAPQRDTVNRKVLRELKNAHIPVVLLDRCVLEYPERSEYDLVCLDNRRAGFIMTDHLIQMGARRIGFLAVPSAAETVGDRITGYREALIRSGYALNDDLILRVQPDDVEGVGSALRSQKIDALMCANDHTAARVMQTLLQLGVKIPDDLRITGVDDVRYAELLPVPLTTFRQPCFDLGATAISAMLDRIRNPHLPPRSILLNGQLIVRRSCGSV